MLSPLEVIQRISPGTLIIITSKRVAKARPSREIVRYQSSTINRELREPQYQIEVTQNQFRENSKGQLEEKETKMRFFERNIESITII